VNVVLPCVFIEFTNMTILIYDGDDLVLNLFLVSFCADSTAVEEETGDATPKSPLEIPSNPYALLFDIDKPVRFPRFLPSKENLSHTRVESAHDRN
jgi:hypothetical protein